MQSLMDQILHAVEKLSIEQQAQVLELAKSLRETALPPGTPGALLLARRDDFRFEAGEVDAMIRVIEEDCERIDADGW